MIEVRCEPRRAALRLAPLPHLCPQPGGGFGGLQRDGGGHLCREGVLFDDQGEGQGVPASEELREGAAGALPGLPRKVLCEDKAKGGGTGATAGGRKARMSL